MIMYKIEQFIRINPNVKDDPLATQAAYQWIEVPLQSFDSYSEARAVIPIMPVMRSETSFYQEKPYRIAEYNNNTFIKAYRDDW